MFKKGDRVVVIASKGNLKGEVVGFSTSGKVVVHLDGKPANQFKVYEEDRLEKQKSGRYPWGKVKVHVEGEPSDRWVDVYEEEVVGE